MSISRLNLSNKDSAEWNFADTVLRRAFPFALFIFKWQLNFAGLNFLSHPKHRLVKTRSHLKLINQKRQRSNDDNFYFTSCVQMLMVIYIGIYFICFIILPTLLIDIMSVNQKTCQSSLILSSSWSCYLASPFWSLSRNIIFKSLCLTMAFQGILSRFYGFIDDESAPILTEVRLIFDRKNESEILHSKCFSNLYSLRASFFFYKEKLINHEEASLGSTKSPTTSRSSNKHQFNQMDSERRNFAWLLVDQNESQLQNYREDDILTKSLTSVGFKQLKRFFTIVVNLTFLVSLHYEAFFIFVSLYISFVLIPRADQSSNIHVINQHERSLSIIQTTANLCITSLVFFAMQGLKCSTLLSLLYGHIQHDVIEECRFDFYDFEVQLEEMIELSYSRLSMEQSQSLTIHWDKLLFEKYTKLTLKLNQLKRITKITSNGIIVPGLSTVWFFMVPLILDKQKLGEVKWCYYFVSILGWFICNVIGLSLASSAASINRLEHSIWSIMARDALFNENLRNPITNGGNFIFKPSNTIDPESTTNNKFNYNDDPMYHLSSVLWQRFCLNFLHTSIQYMPRPLGYTYNYLLLLRLNFFVIPLVSYFIR